jgi:hypothetical protein
MILNQLFNEGTNWHTDPEQQSMDATRRARLGREREPEGSDAIDARLAANNNARQEYAETGRFWLKQKDTQQHLNDQPYTGKAAANAAALELLKQQPELRGNLVVTAYGPGEQQVTEGRVKELGQDLKDKAMSDDDFKKKYSKTRAEVRAAMREKPVAEGIPDVDHMNGPRGINLPVADTRDILQKPFEFYGNYKEWYSDVNRVNSELLDDNAEYTSMAGGKIISINGKDFAFWSNRNGNGSIDIRIAKKHSGQDVAEGDRPGMKDGRPYSDPLRRHPGNDSYMTPEYLIQKYQDELKKIAAGPYKRSKDVAMYKARIAKLQRQQGVAEGSKEKTPGIALSKAYKKDFDDKKPGQDRAETALTGTYSNTGKPGGELKKKDVAEGVDPATYPARAKEAHEKYLKYENLVDQELRKFGQRLPKSWNAGTLVTKLSSDPKYALALKYYNLSEKFAGLAIWYEDLAKKRQGVAEGGYSGVDDTDTVGFSVNSERAYNAVMARFGDQVDHDETLGIMYVPARMWPQVEQVAFDADGEGAVQADGLDEGEKVGNMDADRFDDAMARLKQLAGAGPMRTVYDPAKRVYKNVPVAQQPGTSK